MYSINIGRCLLYFVLAGLAWFGELPWWVLGLFLLNDVPLTLIYRTKAYRARAAQELAEYEKFVAELQTSGRRAA